MSEKTPDATLPPEAAPLTEEEQAVFDKVKGELGDRPCGETQLIQFVRGYSYEEDWAGKVLEMITKTLDWRKEHDVDTICDRKLEKRDKFKTTWTTMVTGKDPVGHLIAVDRLGAIKPSELLVDFTVEELQMHHVQNQEFIAKMKEEASEKAGMRLYKMVSVLDLDGIGMAHTGSKFTGPARALMDIDQWFYPESMQKMYVVNAPWVFKMIWKVVRPWLHPITQEKIQVCGSNFLEEMAADGIEKDQLPECLGGSGIDLLEEFEKTYAEKSKGKKKKTKKKKKKKSTKEGEDDDEDDDEDEADE